MKQRAMTARAVKSLAVIAKRSGLAVTHYHANGREHFHITMPTHVLHATAYPSGMVTANRTERTA